MTTARLHSEFPTTLSSCIPFFWGCDHTKQETLRDQGRRAVEYFRPLPVESRVLRLMTAKDSDLPTAANAKAFMGPLRDAGIQVGSIYPDWERSGSAFHAGLDLFRKWDRNGWFTVNGHKPEVVVGNGPAINDGPSSLSWYIARRPEDTGKPNGTYQKDGINWWLDRARWHKSLTGCRIRPTVTLARWISEHESDPTDPTPFYDYLIQGIMVIASDPPVQTVIDIDLFNASRNVGDPGTGPDASQLPEWEAETLTIIGRHFTVV